MKDKGGRRHRVTKGNSLSQVRTPMLGSIFGEQFFRDKEGIRIRIRISMRDEG